MKPCKDCPETSNRPAPHPGPRCATHHREALAARKAARHEKYVQDTYRLFPGEYASLYELQRGKCAICQRATGARKKLAVDHDHKTGRPRGLLCCSCNKMLGHGRDDTAFFLRAAGYLNNPPVDQLRGTRELD